MNRDRIIENCDAVLHGFSVDGGGLEEIAATCKQLLTQGVDGYVLVPLEPTTVQANAGVAADDLRTGFETVKHIYREMVKVAP